MTPGVDRDYTEQVIAKLSALKIAIENSKLKAREKKALIEVIAAKEAQLKVKSVGTAAVLEKQIDTLITQLHNPKSARRETINRVYAFTQRMLDFDTWLCFDEAHKASFEGITPITAFTSKAEGAKNEGAYTGVYTLQTYDKEKKQSVTQTALHKQGADEGEVIAEVVGSKLHHLIFPKELAATCHFLVKPDGEVYVRSIFPDKKATMAYQVADPKISNRPKFVRKLKSSLARKIIDKKEGQASLASIFASSWWQGDNDMHTGNFLWIDKGKESHWYKIDHGFGGFRMSDQVINLFDSMAATPVLLGNGIKMVPKNNFWEYGTQEGRFYYSPAFNKAVDQVLDKVNGTALQTTIKEALDSAVAHYKHPNNDWTKAYKALRSYAHHLGMPPLAYHPTISIDEKLVTDIKAKIVDYQSQKLTNRANSMRLFQTERLLPRTLVLLLRSDKTLEDDTRARQFFDLTHQWLQQKIKSLENNQQRDLAKQLKDVAANLPPKTAEGFQPFQQNKAQYLKNLHYGLQKIPMNRHEQMLMEAIGPRRSLVQRAKTGIERKASAVKRKVESVDRMIHETRGKPKR